MLEHQPKMPLFLIAAVLCIMDVSLPLQNIYAQSQKGGSVEPEQVSKKKEASTNLLSTLKRSGFFHKKKRPSVESTKRCAPLSWDVSPPLSSKPKALIYEAHFSTSDFNKDNPFVVVPKNTPTKDVAQTRGLKNWKAFPVKTSRIAEIVKLLVNGKNDLIFPASPEMEELKDKESTEEKPKVELVFPHKTSGKGSMKKGCLLIQRTSLEVGAHYSWDGGIVWVRKQNGTEPVSGGLVTLYIPGKKLKETVTDNNGFARLSGDSIRSAKGPLVLTVRKNEEYAFIVLERKSSPPPKCLVQGRLITDKNPLKPGEFLHFAGVGRRLCLDSNLPGNKTNSLADGSNRLYAVLRMNDNVLNKKQIRWKHGDLVWGKIKTPSDAPGGVAFLSLEYLQETESGSTALRPQKNPSLPGAGYPVAEVQIQSPGPELEIFSEENTDHLDIGLRLMRVWRYPPASLMAHYKLTSFPQIGESKRAFTEKPHLIKEGMSCFNKNGIARITVHQSNFKEKTSRLQVEAWVIVPDGRVLKASRFIGVKEQNKWSIRAPTDIFTREIGFIQVMPPKNDETKSKKKMPVLVLSNNTQKKEDLIESRCFKIGFWGLMVCPFKTHKKGEHLIRLISGESVLNSSNSKNILAKTFLYAKAKTQTDRNARFFFRLHPHRSSYKEGETAKIFVSFPGSGSNFISSSSAILTIHGQGFWSSKNINIFKSALKGEKPVIEIPVVGWMSPSIEIGLFLQTKTGRHGARTQMNISPPDKRLDLEVTVEPKKPKAGKPLCISAHTKTPKGKPISAVIAFTCRSKTTVGFMHRSALSGNVASTGKSQTLLKELKPYPTSWGGFSNNKMSNGWVEKKRYTTSGPYWQEQTNFWNETSFPFRDEQRQADKRGGSANRSPSNDTPLLVMATSPEGRGAICINAPKRAGKYKLHALASAAQQNRGGTGGLTAAPRENFIVWKDLELETEDQIDLELSGPEWVTRGDRVCANAIIKNRTSQRLETKLHWSLKGVSSQKPKNRIFKLEPRSSKNLSLCFVQENKLTLHVKAETSGCSVHRNLVFKTQRLNPLISYHRHVRLMPGKEIKVVPPDCVRSLETIWSADPTLRLFIAFKRLLSYSTKTLEPLIGGILALSARKQLPPSLVSRALKTNGFKSDPIELLNRQVKTLSSLQRPDFVFSTQANGPTASVHLQLAGAQALLKARSSGATINNVHYIRALNLLKRIAKRKISGVSVSDQISALQYLSDEGYPVIDEIKKHTSRLKEKNLCDLSGLLLTAHRAQLDVAILDHILAQIQKKLSKAAAYPDTSKREPFGFEKKQSFFQEPVSDPPYSDFLVPSDCLSNTLNTLHETLPGHQLVDSIATILWRRSRKGVWETEIATSRAMSALASHWTRHQGPLANSRVTVALRNQTVLEAWFVGHSRQTAHYNLSKNIFPANTPRHLKVRVLGDTPLFGYLLAHHVCNEAMFSDKAAFKRHRISSILRMKDSKKTGVPELFKERLELYKGERLQIRLVFSVESNPHQSCLYEPIPGGVELERIGFIEDHFNRFPSPEVWWWKRSRGGVYLCFSPMKPGLYEIAYIVKAKHLGHYHTTRPVLSSWKFPKHPVGSPWPITIVKKPAKHQ